MKCERCGQGAYYGGFIDSHWYCGDCYDLLEVERPPHPLADTPAMQGDVSAQSDSRVPCSTCSDDQIREIESHETLLGWVGDPALDPNTVTKFFGCACGRQWQVTRTAGEWYSLRQIFSGAQEGLSRE